MSRTKQIRYQASLDEDLLIQSGKEFFDTCKGNWNSHYFNNTNPIVAEFACGRGEYTVGLSSLFPEKNFVGVDVKGERMMLGIARRRSQDTSKTNIKNIGFLRTIIHHIDRFFAPGELDEIWIVHPDPRPKGHDERRRLTSPRFLDMYYSLLKPGGILRLKTDDDTLFEYSLAQMSNYKNTFPVVNKKEKYKKLLTGFDLIGKTDDLHTSDLMKDHHGIITHYEREALDRGKTIKYAFRSKS